MWWRMSDSEFRMNNDLSRSTVVQRGMFRLIHTGCTMRSVHMVHPSCTHTYTPTHSPCTHTSPPHTHLRASFPVSSAPPRARRCSQSAPILHAYLSSTHPHPLTVHAYLPPTHATAILSLVLILLLLWRPRCGADDHSPCTHTSLPHTHLQVSRPSSSAPPSRARRCSR